MASRLHRAYDDRVHDTTYLTGQFLLAMPGIGDPRFARAVIAMCAHDAGGALGIGIGTVLPGVGLHSVLRQLDIDPGVAPDVPVHHGGPVEPRRGFVLHDFGWHGQDTVAVAGADGPVWAFSCTIDVLKAIAAGTGPARWLVALGYAGWGEGQLDDEMTRHGWFSTPGAARLLYDVPAEARWEAAFADAGIDQRLLASVTGRA